MNCENTREHLESCEECRLHVVVEARLRTQPVVEPPRGLLARAMKALPRTLPLRREWARLAAAAVLLVGLAAVVSGTGLYRHESMDGARSATERTLRAVGMTVSDLGGGLWKP